MKSRVLFVLLLVVALFILVGRTNHTLQDTILNFVSPIKKNYKQLTRSVKDQGDTYIFQKESIQKLTKENKVLRKYLLDQTHYLQQVASLYRKIPSLEKLPHRSIEVVDTISYTRLNSFNEVQLSRPKKSSLTQERLYGLIEGDVVGGTAVMRGDHLYGYLPSNARCRFGVFVGKSRAPGIAQGLDKETMVIKFIPKWAKIAVGDVVDTSGLDGIFFANVPVGIVKEVKIEDSYKSAYIKVHSDTLHPDTFFLITDPAPYLSTSYDKNTVELEQNSTLKPQAASESNGTISSLPKAVQTQESMINPAEFEIPNEPQPSPPLVLLHPKPVKKAKPKRRRPKRKTKTKPRVVTPAPAPVAEPASDLPATPAPTEAPKPKRKRPSAMDIINGRGF